MPKTLAFICVLALSGVVAAPALADCAADVKAAEVAAAEASDASKKAEADKHITEAKSHLAMGHEDVCAQHVRAAMEVLDLIPHPPKI